MAVNITPTFALIGEPQCMAEDSAGNVFVGGSLGIEKFIRSGTVLAKGTIPFSISFTSGSFAPSSRSVDSMISVGDSVYCVNGNGFVFRIDTTITLLPNQDTLQLTMKNRLFSYNGNLYIAYFESFNNSTYLKIRRRTSGDLQILSYRVPVGTNHISASSPPAMMNNKVYFETNRGVYIIKIDESVEVEFKDKLVFATTVLGNQVYFVEQNNQNETFNLCGTDKTNVFFIQNKRRSQTVEGEIDNICMIWKYPKGNTSSRAIRSLISTIRFPIQLLITNNNLYILGKDSLLFNSPVEIFGTRYVPPVFEEIAPINEEPIYIIEQMPIPQMWQNIHMGKEGKNVSTPNKASLMPYRTFGPIADVPGKQPNCIPRHLKIRSSHGEPVRRYFPGLGVVQVGIQEDPESRIVSTWPPSPF